MASVFLSYDREDANRARSIALALEKAGHSVWWDRHIKGGTEFSKEIEHALAAAEVIVVLWSQQSVESAWVRDEAAAGRDTQRLVPVKIDGTEPPLGFRQLQAIDLELWLRRRRKARLQELLDAIDSLASSKDEPARPAPPRTAIAKRARFIGPLMIGLVVIAAIGAGLFTWRTWRPDAAVPVVLVAAGNPSAATRALTQDLLAKVGSLSFSGSSNLELIGEGGGASKADLRFEITAGQSNQKTTANVALLAGKSRGILWSRDFAAFDGSPSALRQQMAVSMAQALGCAIETLGPNTKRLKPATAKLYINGCAKFAAAAIDEIDRIVISFEEVVAQEPTFRPVWAKLLAAQAGTAYPGNEPAIQSLRHSIQQARAHFPDLPEAYLAEATLIPKGRFADRMRLIEQAVKLESDSSSALVSRALLYLDVGRMSESIQDADRAAKINPLSLGTKTMHINALGHAGRQQNALKSLEQAEQFWPGAIALQPTSYGVHVRNGDPVKALRLFRSGPSTSRLQEAFLLARIEPTEANIGKMLALSRSQIVRVPQSIGLHALNLAQFGREDELHATLMRANPAFWESNILFRPTMKKFRSNPRFMRVAARFGLTEYWRESGKWPDFCFEPDLPYDCKAEAAKLAA